MTSQREMAMGLIRACVNDAIAHRPELKQSMDFYLKSLFHQLQTRGCNVLFSDFPKDGKRLDKSLSTGFYIPPKASDEAGLLRSFSKERYAPLWNEIFESRPGSTGIHVRYDVDPTAIFHLRTLLYLFKKVKVTCPEENVRAGVTEWVENDRSLRDPSLHWDAKTLYFNSSLQVLCSLSFKDQLSYEELTCPSIVKTMTIMDRVSMRISAMWPTLSVEDIKPRHGPGAVADLKASEDKYTLPNWPRKLEEFFPQDYFAYSTEEWARSDSAVKSCDEVDGRLSAVPKTYDSPRLITVEPTSHQFLQQGLLQWLRSKLPRPLRNSIAFHDQEPSRAAARSASITGMEATVDLKSASDRLSLWTVERIFRDPALLSAFYATRTHTVVDGTGSGVFDRVYQKKFAGQGSAVTFPVQSVCYAVMAISAVIADAGLTGSLADIRWASQRVRVFGDDIVLPSSALQHLSLILTQCELRINMGKTHYEGHFRESCGGDYWHGYDVTPLYLSHIDHREMKNAQLCSWVDVTNNAFEKGLWRLSEYMENQISKRTRDLIPISSTRLSCLTLRCASPGTVGKRCGYSKPLQAPIVKGLVPKVRKRVMPRKGAMDLLAFFLESRESQEDVHSVHRPWSSGYAIAGRSVLRPSWVIYYT